MTGLSICPYDSGTRTMVAPHSCNIVHKIIFCVYMSLRHIAFRDHKLYKNLSIPRP